MDFKLLASTFALIFLAELGDKTQLAAFAATAGSRSPWSIFVGASAALVLSTALAVLFGEAIQRLVPQHYLKLGAGILFVVFGGLLIASAIHTRSAATAPAAAGWPAWRSTQPRSSKPLPRKTTEPWPQPRLMPG
jgi:putative Ca2+/H+ antiporter (TMEM165/GDT1 family)